MRLLRSGRLAAALALAVLVATVACTGASGPLNAPVGRTLERPLYSETFYPRYHFGWSELLSATEERYRFIRAPRGELYDRLRDAREHLHAGLADCLARLGREAEAEAEFRQEIALIPYSREARIGLGRLFRSQGRDAEARNVVTGIVTANPRAGADEYVVVARTLARLGDAEAARDWARRGRALHPADPRLR